MHEDRARWDARYADAPLASPVAPIALAASADARALLPSSGRAVDVACGTGAQALWLAAAGFGVVALDVSPVAAELVRRGAVSVGLHDRIEARVHDLDDGLPGDLHDVDVVVCQRFRDPRLYAQMIEVLRPGGIAVVTVLSGVGLDVDAGPHHARPGEMVNALAAVDAEIVFHHEEAGQASIVARRRG